MGPYCRYCDRRCFLLRVTKNGQSVLLATCHRGMAHDLATTGQTHETSVNPILDPEAARRIAAAPEPLLPEELCEYCHHHTNAHTYPPVEDGVPVAVPVACVGCPRGRCPRDTCAGCGSRIVEIAGEWVVADPKSSGDGLSYCPPDPDASDHGHHRPAAPGEGPVG